MGSLRKILTLKLPPDVIYNAIKKLNFKSDWFERYCKDLFRFQYEKCKIISDIPNKKICVQANYKEFYEKRIYEIESLGEESKLTITIEYNHETDDFDKLTMMDDIYSFLMLEIGYNSRY